MACGMQFLMWLSDTDRLPRRGRVLDIGESCLLAATAAQLRTLARRHGCIRPDAELDPVLEEFARRSTLFSDPHIPTLFLGEFLELTDIEYVAFDVVATRKAERFDLNIHTLAENQRGAFDLVLNFGTTEHLVNQFNAFRVMHDAVRPGGFIFHQIPATGFLSHGFFCYTPMFFRALAEANGYELAEMWFMGPLGEGQPVVNSDAHPGIVDADKPFNDVGAHRVTTIPDNVINVLFRKPECARNGASPRPAEFRVALELSTSSGTLRGDARFDSPFIQVPPAPVAAPSAGILRRTLRSLGLTRKNLGLARRSA